jgi:galactokinase
MRRLVVSAPGRACLFGEHMDWCGYYVIPVAVDMRSFLEVSLNDRPGFVEVYSYEPFDTYAEYCLRDLRIDLKSDLRYVGGVLKAMLMEGSIKGCESLRLRFMRACDVSKLTGDCGLKDLPVKKGLSSSAAISVATAAAVDLALNCPEDPEGLFKDCDRLTRYASLAYTGENKVLGINCGQMDQYASAYGGFLFIDCRCEPARVERLNPRIEIPLVVGDTGQGKDTPRILAWLGGRFRRREREFMEGVEGIVNVVLEAREELRKDSPDLYKLGELMNLNQHYLARYLKVSSDCPVSPNRLDELIKAALDAGALGAKLSGSGGGGAMVALCHPDDVDRVAEAIRRVGGYPYVTKVADKGLRMEYFEG